jgi:hypothetical protein
MPLIGLLPLVLLSGIAIWQRLRGDGARYVLVEVGKRERWRIRPPLLRKTSELSVLRDVAGRIHDAGLGDAEALKFLGRPTMDLIVRADDANGAALQIAAALGACDARVSIVRDGKGVMDLRLWRYW